MNAFVDQLLTKFTTSTQERVNELRSLILTTDPDIKEKYKYKTAVYYYKDQKAICYLTIKPHLIIVGFIHGKKLQKKSSKLYGNQKFVRHFNATDNKFDEQLIHLLITSISIINGNNF